jgi:hypothetical protein
MSTPNATAVAAAMEIAVTAITTAITEATMAEAAMSDCIHIDIRDIVGDALDANPGVSKS